MKKTKSKQESELTIMVVKKVGKIRSFKVSPKFLFWASLITVLYLFVSIFIINDYLEKRRSNNALSNRLTALQNELVTAKRELYRSKQRLTLLENLDRSSEAMDKKEMSKDGPEKTEQKKTEPAPEERPPDVFEHVPENTFVDVKDLSIREENSTLKLEFKLVNTKEDNDPINGYVHIIASNSPSSSFQQWSYPNGPIKNGLPVNYRRGQPFIIRYFKTIEGEHPLNSKGETPSLIKIIVYNRSGKLLLIKEFEVENAT